MTHDTQGQFWKRCADNEFTPRQLLIWLPLLRQETLFYEPDSFRFVYRNRKFLHDQPTNCDRMRDCC